MDLENILLWGSRVTRDLTPTALDVISGAHRWRNRLLTALHNEDRGEDVKKQLFLLLDTLTDDDRLRYVMEIGMLWATMAVISEYVVYSVRNDPSTITSHTRMLIYCSRRNAVLENICLPTLVLLRDILGIEMLRDISSAMDNELIHGYLFEDTPAAEVASRTISPLICLYCAGCVSTDKLTKLISAFVFEEQLEPEFMFDLVHLDIMWYKTGWMLLTEQEVIRIYDKPLGSYNRIVLPNSTRDRLEFLIRANAEV